MGEFFGRISSTILKNVPTCYETKNQDNEPTWRKTLIQNLYYCETEFHGLFVHAVEHICCRDHKIQYDSHKIPEIRKNKLHHNNVLD